MKRFCEMCGAPVVRNRCERCHGSRSGKDTVAWVLICVTALAGLALLGVGFAGAPTDWFDEAEPSSGATVPVLPNLPPKDEHRAIVMLVGDPIGTKARDARNGQSCAEGVRNSRWFYSAGDEVLVTQGREQVDAAELSGGEWEHGVCTFDLHFEARPTSAAPEFTFPDGETFPMHKYGEAGSEGLSIYLRQ